MSPVVMYGRQGNNIVLPFRKFVHDGVGFHHTNAAGLLGILESNCLWASSPVALNDSAEVRHGLTVLQSVWSEMDKDGAEPAHVPIVDGLISELGETLASSVFVLSSTGRRDSLNQWQGYSSTQGYAIGLDMGTFLNPLLRGHPFDPNVGAVPVALPGWYEVIYDEQAQIDACKEALTFVAGDTLHSEAADPCVSSETAIMLLGTLVASIKHPTFSDEREYRYMVTNTGSGGDLNTLWFRSSTRGLVPYLKLVERDMQNSGGDPRGSLPLREIICGPGSDREAQDLNIALTTRLLALHGYDNVPVTASRVPYRP